LAAKFFGAFGRFRFGLGEGPFKRDFSEVLVFDKEGRIMFRILVYDVRVDRVSKVRRYLSDKLFWTQNSTFEGFLSEPQKTIVLQQLSSFLDPDEDSILIFSTEAEYAWEKRTMGIKKNVLENWIR
jgi:CRISPR-associated protein Cas2